MQLVEVQLEETTIGPVVDLSLGVALVIVDEGVGAITCCCLGRQFSLPSLFGLHFFLSELVAFVTLPAADERSK